jgi:hypothetical protein
MFVDYGETDALKRITKGVKDCRVYERKAIERVPPSSFARALLNSRQSDPTASRAKEDLASPELAL